ncbi:very-long-chain enoyl-CoA reductase [Diaphorina citri]|uniref:very-long-chain enoyl-CoA reductase n=1 Tax=Diaphorina citri TaxID=121845 RepID=A0A3Q0J6G2_DIACI|nr:very-long-chain enoyl-CoA reductase [Diaphorina citri]
MDSKTLEKMWATFIKATLQVSGSFTVKDIKKEVHKAKSQLYPDRQAVRLEIKGKILKDSDDIKSLGLKNGDMVFIKDLGPQIGWSTVFMAEYAGPLFVYLIFYYRPWIFYGSEAASKPYSYVAHLAALCYIVHYTKRVLETLFVHRFSHATEKISTNFKLTTLSSQFCQLGNLSIHLALRDLRPPGTNVRRIPVATSNPFTSLFDYVSCPNYTYEFGSWLSFSLLTSCFPALLFASAGMYQMTVWALGKHKNYKKEFPDYPKQRKAIVPFVI